IFFAPAAAALTLAGADSASQRVFSPVAFSVLFSTSSEPLNHAPLSIKTCRILKSPVTDASFPISIRPFAHTFPFTFPLTSTSPAVILAVSLAAGPMVSCPSLRRTTPSTEPSIRRSSAPEISPFTSKLGPSHELFACKFLSSGFALSSLSGFLISHIWSLPSFRRHSQETKRFALLHQLRNPGRGMNISSPFLDHLFCPWHPGSVANRRADPLASRHCQN